MTAHSEAVSVTQAGGPQPKGQPITPTEVADSPDYDPFEDATIVSEPTVLPPDVTGLEIQTVEMPPVSEEPQPTTPRTEPKSFKPPQPEVEQTPRSTQKASSIETPCSSDPQFTVRTFTVHSSQSEKPKRRFEATEVGSPNFSTDV